MYYLRIINLTVYLSDITKNSIDKSVKILNNINIFIEKGEIIGIVGPTGSGKTVLLKTIAGLIKPSVGYIFIYDNEITMDPPYTRNISMVFQDYALYPHLTNKGNLIFPFFIKNYKQNYPEINPDSRTKEIADLLNINEEKLLNRKPKFISGGEKQRVAIGKAIAILPDLLLMDEPFSNIEPNLRLNIRKNIRKMIKENNITCIYVSHNQLEVAEIADKIIVMNGGRIEQIGTYNSLFNNPLTLFVSLFIGKGTTNWLKSEDTFLLTNGRFNYDLTIRPEECLIYKENTNYEEENLVIEGEVAVIENHFENKNKIVYIDYKDNLFGVEIPLDYPVEKSQKIKILIPIKKVKFFDKKINNQRVYINE